MSRRFEACASYRIGAAVTPSDSVDLPGGHTTGLLVATLGNVDIHDSVGNRIQLTSVPANTILPLSASRVRLGTTATVVALY